MISKCGKEKEQNVSQELIFFYYCFPGGSEVKASACNVGDPGSIPGLGRSSGEGNGNPLQYSCLENPMDGGAWWATVHGVAKSWTRLSDFTFTFHFQETAGTGILWLFFFFLKIGDKNLIWKMPSLSQEERRHSNHWRQGIWGWEICANKPCGTNPDLPSYFFTI